MIVIYGNSSKSRINLDTDFDTFTLENTLTQKVVTFTDLTPVWKGGLYYSVVINFSDLELGEYKYQAIKEGKVVQSGLLDLRPFDKDEEPVQVVVPEVEREIITYKGYIPIVEDIQ